MPVNCLVSIQLVSLASREVITTFDRCVGDYILVSIQLVSLASRETESIMPPMPADLLGFHSISFSSE